MTVRTFEYEVLSEFPGVASNIVYIPSYGGGSGHDGVIIKFLPNNGEPWIGVFAFGDSLRNEVCWVNPGPGPSQLTILARGRAYIASPNNPNSYIDVKSFPAITAIPVLSRGLMLFHDYTEIVAYDEQGLAWETSRISWDGIEIDEISDNTVLGRGWDAPSEEWVQFNVDLTTGSHQGGSAPPTYPNPDFS